MLSGAVVSRYARGLLAYAQAHEAVDALDTAFHSIGQAVSVSPELSGMLANPILPVDAKLSIIEKLLQGALRKDLRNFLALVLSRGRGSYIGAIAERFHELVDEVHGRLQIDIEAAQPLTQEQTDSIVAALSKAYGKQIVARTSQNADLIAGYRVRVGNRVLDATTQNALRQFRDSLLAGAARREGTR